MNTKPIHTLIFEGTEKKTPFQSLSEYLDYAGEYIEIVNVVPNYEILPDIAYVLYYKKK